MTATNKLRSARLRRQILTSTATVDRRAYNNAWQKPDAVAILATIGLSAHLVEDDREKVASALIARHDSAIALRHADIAPRWSNPIADSRPVTPTIPGADRGPRRAPTDTVTDLLRHLRHVSATATRELARCDFNHHLLALTNIYSHECHAYGDWQGAQQAAAISHTLSDEIGTTPQPVLKRAALEATTDLAAAEGALTSVAPLMSHDTTPDIARMADSRRADDSFAVVRVRAVDSAGVVGPARLALDLMGGMSPDRTCGAVRRLMSPAAVLPTSTAAVAHRNAARMTASDEARCREALTIVRRWARGGESPRTRSNGGRLSAAALAACAIRNYCDGRDNAHPEAAVSAAYRELTAAR